MDSIPINKQEIIQLTKDIYRLTLLFPKREPLRYKIREAADDILASCASGKDSNSLALFESTAIIVAFLEVALAQDWVSAALVLDIKNSYDKIKNLAQNSTGKDNSAAVCGEQTIIYVPAASMPELIENKVFPKASSVEKQPEDGDSDEESEEAGDVSDKNTGSLSEGQIIRQTRILEYLKEKGQSQVWEIQKFFPDISKRTIRRDFRALHKQGIIERVGERNKTYYKMKVNTI